MGLGLTETWEEGEEEGHPLKTRALPKLSAQQALVGWVSSIPPTEFAVRGLGQQLLCALLCSRPASGMSQRAAEQQPPPWWRSPGKVTWAKHFHFILKLSPAEFSCSWPGIPGAVCSCFAQGTLL